MKMRDLIITGGFLALATGAAGCGDSAVTDEDPKGDFPTALVGSWTVSCAHVADPAGVRTPVNLVARADTFSLALGSGGRFSKTERGPNETLFTSAGAVTDVNGVSLAFTPDGGEPSFQWDYVISGPLLTLSFEETFDFNGDGADDGNGSFLIEMIEAGRDRQCPSVAAVAGSWSASTIDVSDPSGLMPDVEIVAGGASFSIVFGSGGEFQQSFRESGASFIEISEGVFAVVGNSILLNETDGTLAEWEFVSAGGDLNISLTDSWDFDGDGAEEPANFSVRLVVSGS